ncbi:MAG: cobalt-precorrin-5B (C(1))-methyltransferase, partial [Nitrosopumilaceae archaeon]|nr:cobalt-precorrin-5B (C(1))-methyltransferase [Nitrosopumilaceae archaeon]
MEKKLRTGFTTGTCATAASKAAYLAIKNQKKIEKIEVRLPKGDYITIPINSCEFSKDSAICSVIKDGGDDPDVTHGAEIFVELKFTQTTDEIKIEGGEGVGVVTKPGLGLEINKPAINPVPKKMIKENLQEVAKDILEK